MFNLYTKNLLSETQHYLIDDFVETRVTSLLQKMPKDKESRYTVLTTIFAVMTNENTEELTELTEEYYEDDVAAALQDMNLLIRGKLSKDRFIQFLLDPRIGAKVEFTEESKIAIGQRLYKFLKDWMFKKDSQMAAAVIEESRYSVVKASFR